MKTSRGRELLTENQRNELMHILADEWILGTNYTFSEQDLAEKENRSILSTTI